MECVQIVESQQRTHGENHKCIVPHVFVCGWGGGGGGLFCTEVPIHCPFSTYQ